MEGRYHKDDHRYLLNSGKYTHHDIDAFIKQYKSDGIWKDEGTYYYPSNWSAFKIYDSGYCELGSGSYPTLAVADPRPAELQVFKGSDASPMTTLNPCIFACLTTYGNVGTGDPDTQPAAIRATTKVASGTDMTKTAYAGFFTIENYAPSVEPTYDKGCVAVMGMANARVAHANVFGAWFPVYDNGYNADCVGIEVDTKCTYASRGWGDATGGIFFNTSTGTKTQDNGLYIIEYGRGIVMIPTTGGVGFHIRNQSGSNIGTTIFNFEGPQPDAFYRGIDFTNATFSDSAVFIPDAQYLKFGGGAKITGDGAAIVIDTSTLYVKAASQAFDNSLGIFWKNAANTAWLNCAYLNSSNVFVLGEDNVDVLIDNKLSVTEQIDLATFTNSSPAEGDLWFNGTHLYFRIGSTSYQIDQQTGSIDHGALTGLGDNDHPQYLLLTDIDDSPVNGVTNAPISSNWAYDHVAAADPHTGYRLESADHTHQSTGAQAGQLDHGLALTGLTDDDHTQYVLLAGRSAGQVIYGSTAASGTLSLEGTSHSTDGAVYIVDSTLGIDNSKPIYFKNAAGTYKNLINFSADDQLKLGEELAANKFMVNVDGGMELVTCGANDSGGTGYKYLRIPNY